MSLFDPAVDVDMESIQACSAIYEGLVKFAPDSYEIKPCLARKWFTSDYKTWTFYLTKGIKFHDGTDFTSSSVKFNFDRQLNPIHPFHKPSYGSFETYRRLFGKYGDYIQRIETPEKYKIRIVLAKPDVLFPSKLAIPASFMVSPYSINQQGNNFASCPVGTGPYEFSEWRISGRMILTRNQTYRDFVSLDRLIFESYTIPDHCLRQLERGNIDIAAHFLSGDSALIKEITDSGKLLYKAAPVDELCLLLLNSEKEELSTAALRRALSALIDRKDISETFGVKQAHSFLTPSLPGYKKRNFEYNMSDVSKLLDNISQGRALLFIYPAEPVSYSANPEELAHKIRNYLKAGGLKIILKKLPRDEYKKALERKNYDLALSGASDISGCSDIYLSLLDPVVAAKFGRRAKPQWLGKYDELMQTCRNTVKPSLRAKLLCEADELLCRNMIAVPIFYTEHAIIYSKSISNIEFHPSGILNLQKVQTTKK